MMKNTPYILTLMLAIIFVSACKDKPKPISKNITKTTVVVNNKKDSVINNPQKNYGNATISNPCTKLLLQNVQSTSSYKQIIAGKPASGISYTVNWVAATEPKIRTNGGKITNGIEVIVNETKDKTKSKIGSYIYNNEDAKLYYINTGNQYDLVTDVDSTGLKQIRNGCYWGVASHK
ncbi:hypothetical protein [Mucilaginibacter agri]|uniref:Lipoprotein n=1 Tax=Mucilaginibacter agri TaxID=2695265 RepID=A0A965ZI20_9SPHI|nr:hypothetical protein [Mucilaginibacter agri]NCD70097.1 hypothetical protein [Mucilaginibacter agri]